MCVCVSERERERERGRGKERSNVKSWSLKRVYSQWLSEWVIDVISCDHMWYQQHTHNTSVRHWMSLRRRHSRSHAHHEPIRAAKSIAQEWFPRKKAKHTHTHTHAHTHAHIHTHSIHSDEVARASEFVDKSLSRYTSFVFPIEVMMCDVWCMMYDVWCMMYDVWCAIYDVWCMMYDVWCMMYDVWCAIYDVWCMMYEVWCMMYDVWCMMYDDNSWCTDWHLLCSCVCGYVYVRKPSMLRLRKHTRPLSLVICKDIYRLVYMHMPYIIHLTL